MSRATLPALLLLLLLLVALPPGSSHHEGAIQPGAQGNVDPGYFPGTLNFIYKDAAGVLYIGAAAHAIHPVGHRVGSAGLGEFGTVVYRHRSETPPCSDAGLIRIDHDKVGLVDASVRRWGGPAGVQTDFSVGQATLHYGQAYYVSQTEAGRARVGMLRGVASFGVAPCLDERYFVAANPVSFGDSGSPMLTGDGQALGVVTYLTVWGGTTAGMTVQALLAEFRANGFPTLELVTAPFDPVSAASLAASAEATIAHCVDDPLGPYRSDACVRREACVPTVDPATRFIVWSCVDPLA